MSESQISPYHLQVTRTLPILELGRWEEKEEFWVELESEAFELRLILDCDRSDKVAENHRICKIKWATTLTKGKFYLVFLGLVIEKSKDFFCLYFSTIWNIFLKKHFRTFMLSSLYKFMSRCSCCNLSSISFMNFEVLKFKTSLQVY